MSNVVEQSGVLVVAEAAHGEPTALTHELLGLAHRLCRALGGDTTAVLLGKQADGAGGTLIAQGASRVYLAPDEHLSDYQADAWLPALTRAVGDVSPAVVLIGHTTSGADLAPRLAFRLGTSVAMGCIAIAVEQGKVLMTRPCYGGNALEVVSLRTSPAVATIKAKSQEALERDDRRSGELIRLDVKLGPGDIRTRICEQKTDARQGSQLETADVIVSGGRGLNGPDGFKLAAELARLLGGAVGASRVACDLGWCPPSYQIGLSGRTVAPELYIALGISGAGQHMAGCASSKSIVSINTDADAEIFKFSRFGVVGDCRAILPLLIDEVRKLKEGAER